MDGDRDEAEWYVGTIEITELQPNSALEDKFEATLLRRFLNIFNNHLYVLIRNSRAALTTLAGEQPAHDRIREIADSAKELDSAVKRLQSIVEGKSHFRGGGTVLVVEDHEGVRKLVVETMRECGYTVLTASGGPEALNKCESYPGAIHLALVDVGMEPMDGYELVRRIKIVRPETNAIYMSGNFPDHARAMPGTEFLMKGSELAGRLPELVRQMMSRS